MTDAPGIYDDECSVLAMLTEGQLVAAIVLGGVKGTGFSVKAVDPKLLAELPDMLITLAAQIRNDVARNGTGGDQPH